MGWRQLQSIYAEAAADLAAEQAERPTACPNCGEPLDEAYGVLNCPRGDYRFPPGGSKWH